MKIMLLLRSVETKECQGSVMAVGSAFVWSASLPGSSILD